MLDRTGSLADSLAAALHAARARPSGWSSCGARCPAASSSPTASASRASSSSIGSASTISTSTSSRSTPAGCFPKPTRCGRRPSAAMAAASAPSIPSVQRSKPWSAASASTASTTPSRRAYACCNARKVKPLDAALDGADGLDHRRARRSDRDAARSRAGRRSTTAAACSSSIRCSTGAAPRCSPPSPPHDVPVNALHAKGFVSDRLRAVHARGFPRRTGAQRPLVVGERRRQGMRPAPAARPTAALRKTAACG